MPRYNITLFYPNGSTSHQLITTNVYKARARCAQIFQDYDLREVASRLLVRYGTRVLFDAAPASIPYDDCEGVINWPENKAPLRYKDYTRATVSLPAALMNAARRDGDGNLSKGLLTALLTVHPELQVEILQYQD